MKLRAALLFSTLSFSLVFAQPKPAPVPPLQTPRQALIEIITGGPKAMTKHLTVEVQQLLAKPGGQGATAMAAFGDLSSQLGSDAQTFETGPMLLVSNQPQEHAKLEVRVENDDLSGDEDTLDLSLRVVHDDSEQEPAEWEAFLRRFTVNLKKQAGIWRLNKIGIGVEFPLGDPEFLQKTFFKGPKATGAGLVVSTSSSEPKAGAEEQSIPPEQIVLQMTFAEQAFASAHPDIGFSCSLTELAETAAGFGMDPQVASGTYHGYKLSLTGCQGRPAGSFQVIAEPMPGNAGKAFCTDATHNVRVSDDGRGSTCLNSGKVPARSEESETLGVDLVQRSEPAKDKD